MSQPPPAPGWWMASDGNWYSPELHPDPAHRAAHAPVEADAFRSPSEIDHRGESALPSEPPSGEMRPSPTADGGLRIPYAPPPVPTPSPPTTWGGRPGDPEPEPPAGSNRAIAVVAFLAALGMIVGSFGPWASFGGTYTGSQSGWGRADGIVTIACALVACGVAGMLLAGARNVFLKLVLMLSGVTAFVVFVIDAVDISDEADRAREMFEGLEISIGWGFWLVGAAGLVITVAALLERSPWALPSDAA